MIRVISTKKLKPSLVAAARAEGFFIEDHDFIKIEPVWSAENQLAFDKILATGVRHFAFTSAHAVENLKRYLAVSNQQQQLVTDWKIFCLSGATSEAVIKLFHSKENVVATADQATDLAKKIAGHHVPELIFICGKQRRDELPQSLRSSGVSVYEFVVYETVLQPKIVPATDAVLFFSPSAVKSFFSANELKAGTVCFVVGATTANAVKEMTGNAIAVSAAPTQEAVLDSLYRYYKNKN